MGIIEIILLGIGLAMDAFAVSVCKGLAIKKLNWKNTIIIASYFGIFQAAMPVIGYLLGSSFANLITRFDHWIAFILLLIIGVNMIRDSFADNSQEKNDKIDFKTMTILALATSIDALAIGISFAFLGVQDYTEILPPISIIGFVSFVMSLIGLIFGIQCGCGIARKLKAELWGGIILVIIGLKILIEHLFLQ